MKNFIRTLVLFLEDLFFPKICEGCGKVGSYLCERCIQKEIELVRKQKCHVCKKKLTANSRQLIAENMVHEECKEKTNLDGVFVVAKYSKFIENFIGDIKYEFYFAMMPDLMKIMTSYLEKNGEFMDLVKDSVFTFVPLHFFRKNWRGFNQSEEMAKILSKNFNVPCVKLLKRKRNTKHQVGLARKERINNIKNSFLLGRLDQLDRFDRIFIVDDVMTTGSTLEECARVLKKSGVKRVYGLVFARG